MNTKNMQNKDTSKRNSNSQKAYSDNTHLVKTDLFGVGITNETPENILEYIVRSLQKKQKPYYVVTPNPEMIVLASKNPAFRKVLNNAEIASNDGVGLGIAARILGKSLHSRLTGVSLLENVCKRVVDWPITVAFLGGRPKVAEKAAECLKKKYPGLKVAYATEETDSPERLPAADILFVALGAPKQEFWMAEHLGKVKVTVMVGVGGALDYISGGVVRAPSPVRALGLEWLFRLIVQPWRWRRQLALPVFAWMVFKERMGK